MNQREASERIQMEASLYSQGVAAEPHQYEGTDILFDLFAKLINARFPGHNKKEISNVSKG